MHAQLLGIRRDQLMTKHKANNIQVAYASDAQGVQKSIGS